MSEPSRKFKAAAVQLSPVLFSRDGTTEKVCAAILEAGRAGARLVVFPETFIPYYPYFSFIKPPVSMGADHLQLYEQAVVVPSPTTDRLGAAARRAGAVVVIGVNERDHGTLYNTQLVFDADGTLLLSRRKITLTYHERMIWGQGDGSGLHAVDTQIGRLGTLACWEHYNPLARYALMADHEQIHASMFPGSLVGKIFAQQIEVTIRHHALESGCFVVNSTGFLTPEQVSQIAGNTGLDKALSGGCFTAIVNPEGTLLGEPLTDGEGMVIAEIDLDLITKRKRMMDSVGHYSRPELLSLRLDATRHTQLAVSPAFSTAREPFAPTPSNPLGTDSHDPLIAPARDGARHSLPPLADAPSANVLSELQALGLRWLSPSGPGLSRAGGAGPSDHKAIQLAGQTLMVPIFTHAASTSPFSARVSADGAATLWRGEHQVGEITFPKTPRFYELFTADRTPYWKIARLHASDVLATTVLQTCTRYGHRSTSCQFCAIGQSLAAKQTIAEKTPEQLAEVARAAVLLDGVKHVVMTTGTPATPDRGASVLSRAARAIKASVVVPVQAQCEPPDDFAWFQRLEESGVDTLGMHLEAVSEDVRRRIMPGKAEVPVSFYYEAFEAAVKVFGRGQVSTYLLAGLGDSAEALLSASERLIALGVYPFVVPFVPIAHTPLEHHPAPDPAFLGRVLDGVAALLDRHGMSASQIKAGCGRCGACSSLKARERRPTSASAGISSGVSHGAA